MSVVLYFVLSVDPVHLHLCQGPFRSGFVMHKVEGEGLFVANYEHSRGYEERAMPPGV